MSGWVCSARKFVVSSFVSFAEELENAVLVLTDAEKAREHGQNLQKSGLVLHDDTPGLTDVRFGQGHVSQDNVFEIETSTAASGLSALTTQPESFTPMLSATSSMTSLPSICSSQNSPSLLNSSLTSHSLPDIANSSKIFQLSSPSPNTQSSTVSRLPSEASRKAYHHNPHVHRCRKPRHSSSSPTKERNYPSSKQNLPQTDHPTSNSAVIIGSKRPKEKSIFNLKRPGKVIRTSSNEARSVEAEDDQPDAISEGLVHASNEWSQMDPHKNLSVSTPNISSPRMPEDLSIPNRCVQSTKSDDFPLEHIPRASLVDKLSHILHSTLVTISNLLRLESEEMTTIYRSARSIQAAGEETDHGTMNYSGAFDEHLERSMSENDYIEILADGNLNVSRINSLVSLESFEVLSRDDDNILPIQSTEECNHSSIPSQNLDNKALPCECEDQQSFPKDHEYSGVPMEASIEFIHFEVSDLITKRYFDSKTQRFMTFPSDDTTLQEGEEAVSSGGVTGRKRCEQTEDSMEAMSGTSPGEDDDGSSVSFDVISEDACHEPFNIL